MYIIQIKIVHHVDPEPLNKRCNIKEIAITGHNI